MTTEIAIVGAEGRMGQTLLETASDSDQWRIVSAVVRPGSEAIGATIGPSDAPATDDPQRAASRAEVVVDFSVPEATATVARVAGEQQTALVSGTTGLTEQEQSAVERAAEKTALLRASNFSVGITLLDRLVELASGATDGDFDIEITEAHHRHKVDAPSGTALMLGETAAAARDHSLDEVARHAREGDVGERPDDEIGFQVLRGGGIVGEHTVHVCGPDEKLELTHRSLDRAIFARGALRAASWLAGREPGRYEMSDVLFG